MLQTCLNETVYMLRGEQCVPWNVAAAPLMLLCLNLIPDMVLLDEILPSNPERLGIPLAFWELRAQLEGRVPNRATMEHLLFNLSCILDCSDPRDSVFGFLGLASDVEELGVKADYTKSYEEVITDLTVRMISHQGLRVLHNCFPDAEKDGTSMPSWVIRWKQDQTYKPSRLKRHDASHDWNGSPEFSIDRSTLYLPGIRLASVEKTTPSFTGYLYCDWRLVERIDQLVEVVNAAQRHLRSHCPNPDEVIAYTLVNCEKGGRFRPETQNVAESRGVRPPGSSDSARETSSNSAPIVSARALRALLLLILTAKHLLQRNPGADAQNLFSVAKEGQSTEEAQLAEMMLLEARLHGRSIVFTDDHRICMTARGTREGDIIALFRGGPSLYVIRPVEDRFTYVGDAYMYGAMNGEIMQEDGWKRRVEVFSLI